MTPAPRQAQSPHLVEIEAEAPHLDVGACEHRQVALGDAAASPARQDHNNAAGLTRKPLGAEGRGCARANRSHRS